MAKNTSPYSGKLQKLFDNEAQNMGSGSASKAQQEANATTGKINQEYIANNPNLGYISAPSGQQVLFDPNQLDNINIQNWMNRHNASINTYNQPIDFGNGRVEKWAMTNAKRGFWESPQRIARFYNVIRSAPPGWKAPAWLDTEAVKSAYEYYKFKNDDKPWTEWKYLAYDDPARGYLQSLQIPPAKILLPSEQKYATQGNSQKAAQQQKIIDYNDLPWWQQAFLSVAVPQNPNPDYNGVQNRSNFSKYFSPIIPSIMAAMGGVAVGATVGGVPGAVVGGVLTGAGTYYQTITGNKVPVVNEMLGFFNVLSVGAERTYGLGQQAQRYGWDEVIKDLPAAWEAAQITYESGETKADMINAFAMAMNLGDQVLSRLGMDVDAEVDLNDLAQPGEVWRISQGETSPVELESGLWGAEAQQALKEILIETGMTENMAEYTWKSLLEFFSATDMTKDPGLIAADFVNQYGDTGMINDLVLSTLLDPANLAPFMGSKLAEPLARKLGHKNLANAFKETRGNPLIDVLPPGLQQIAEVTTGKKSSAGMLGALQAYKRNMQGGRFAATGWDMPEDMRIKYDELKSSGIKEKNIQVDGDTLRWKDNNGANQTYIASAEAQRHIPTIEELTKTQRWLGGLDTKYGLAELAPNTENGGLIGFWNRLTSLTPEAQALEILSISKDGIGHLWSQSKGNFNVFIDELMKAAGSKDVRPGDLNREVLNSPQMRAVKSAIKYALEKGNLIENMAAEWATTINSRNLLNKIAKALEMEPKNILDMLEDNPDGLVKLLNEKAPAVGSATDLKEALSVFTGDDSKAWHPNEQASRLINAMQDGMDEYLVKTYGIKPDSAVIRLSHMLKGVQSLLLLNFSPTYAINNLTNDIATRAFVGVGGFLSPRQVERFESRFGMLPSRANQGIGASGEGIDTGGRSGIFEATQQGDWIDSLYRLTKTTTKKLGVFSTLASRIEKSESKQATVIGMIRFMHDNWKVRKGIRALSPSAEAYLDAKMPGLKQTLYRIAEAGMNMDEIEAAVFGEYVKPAIEGILEEAANSLHPETMGALFSYISESGILGTLKHDLDNAKTPEDIDIAFANLIEHVNDYKREMVAKDILKNAEEVGNKVDAEKAPGILQIYGDLEIEIGQHWVDSRAEWDNLIARRDTLTPGQYGIEAKALTERQNKAWREMNALVLTTIKGIIQKIGIDNEHARAYVNGLIDTHKIWEEFNNKRNRLIREYFEGYEKKSGESPEDYYNRRDREWNTVQDELDLLYKNATIVEAKIQQEMDMHFARTYAQATGWDEARAAKWREDIRNIRAEMVRAQQEMRAKTRNMSLYEKDQAYTEFNKLYNGLIARMKEMEANGAIDLMHPERKVNIPETAQRPGRQKVKKQETAQPDIAQPEPVTETEPTQLTVEPANQASISVEPVRTETTKVELNRIATAIQSIRMLERAKEVLARSNSEERAAYLRENKLMTRRLLRERILAATPNATEKKINGVLMLMDLEADNWARRQNWIPGEDTRDAWYASHIGDVIGNADDGKLIFFDQNGLAQRLNEDDFRQALRYRAERCAKRLTAMIGIDETLIRNVDEFAENPVRGLSLYALEKYKDIKGRIPLEMWTLVSEWSEIKSLLKYVNNFDPTTEIKITSLDTFTDAALKRPKLEYNYKTDKWEESGKAFLWQGSPKQLGISDTTYQEAMGNAMEVMRRSKQKLIVLMKLDPTAADVDQQMLRKLNDPAVLRSSKEILTLGEEYWGAKRQYGEAAFQEKLRKAQTNFFDTMESTDAVQAGLFQKRKVDLGTKLTEYYHNAKDAISKLIELKQGDAVKALYHNEVGDIDLIWGDKGETRGVGYGLAKILEYHPEVVDNLQEIIDTTKIVRRTNNRIILESDTHKAVITLDWYGEEKTWLMTAYQKKSSTSSGTTIDITGLSQGQDGTARLPESGYNNIIADEAINFNNDIRFDNNLKGSVQFNLDDGRALIRVFEKGDISTLVHEIGHIFRRDLSPADLDIVARIGGLKDGNEFTQLQQRYALRLKQATGDNAKIAAIKAEQDYQRWVQAEEYIARAWERYITDGNVPDVTHVDFTTGEKTRLKSILRHFTDWMLNIYKQLFRKDGVITGYENQPDFQVSGQIVQINPELRKIFDSIIDSEGTGKRPLSFDQLIGKRNEAIRADGRSYKMSLDDTQQKARKDVIRYLLSNYKDAKEARQAADDLADYIQTDDGMTDEVAIYDALSAIKENPALDPWKNRVVAKVNGAVTSAYAVNIPGRQYKMVYKVIDMADIQTSDKWSGNTLKPNAEYDQRYQPRDRGELTAREQVESIASKLSPELMLNEFLATDRGAPIISPDNMVLSGNGRTLSLARTIDSYPERWATYRAELDRFAPNYGIDPATYADMKHPVLVRELTGLDDSGVGEFIADANSRASKDMTDFESANADAKRIKPESLIDLQVDENDTIEGMITKRANLDFVKQFMYKIPETERGKLFANGMLTADGVRRIKNAIYAVVYQGEVSQRLLNMFASSQNENIKLLEAAIMKSLPQMGQLKAEIAAGRLNPELDITNDIAAAADRVAWYRSGENTKFKTIDEFLAIDDMFNPLTQLQKNMIRLFSEIKSEKPLREMLRGYVELAMREPDPRQMGMAIFGEVITHNKEELFSGAVDIAGKAEIIRQEPAQQEIFVHPGMVVQPPAEGINAKLQDTFNRGDAVPFDAMVKTEIISDAPDFQKPQEYFDLFKITQGKTLFTNMKDRLDALSYLDYWIGDRDAPNNNLAVKAMLQNKYPELIAAIKLAGEKRNKFIPVSQAEAMIENVRNAPAYPEEYRTLLEIIEKGDVFTTPDQRDMARSYLDYWVGEGEAPAGNLDVDSKMVNYHHLAQPLLDYGRQRRIETALGHNDPNRQAIPQQGLYIEKAVQPFSHGFSGMIGAVYKDGALVAYLPYNNAGIGKVIPGTNAKLLGVDLNDPSKMVYEVDGEVKSINPEKPGEAMLAQQVGGNLQPDITTQPQPGEPQMTAGELPTVPPYSEYSEERYVDLSNPVGDIPLNGTPVTEPYGQALNEITQQVRPVLERARDKYKQAMADNREVKFDNLDAVSQREIRKWLKGVAQDMSGVKYAAMNYGNAMRDAALLNYSRQYGFDSYLGLVAPYQFWYTRSMMNWAKRMIDKPGWTAMYARYQQMLDRQEKTLPTRLRGKVRIPMAWMPEWAGRGMFIDPMKQLFPPDQFFQPFEQAQMNESKVANKAEQILGDMVKTGKITQDKADAALDDPNSTAWKQAMSLAEQELDIDTGATSLASMMLSPALWYTIPKNILEGKAEKNTVLPMTRTGQAIREVGKDTFAEPITNLVGGALAFPEETIRSKSGLSEFGQWGDYYIDRMLANMAAENPALTEAVKIAMIERGGELYDEARSRVAYEQSLRTPGAAPLMALKNGANGIEVAVAAISGIFPGGLFPEGELKQRNLQIDYNNAWKDYEAGDDTALEDFFADNPEYEARMALYDEPEDRLRQFLISTIWDNYTQLERPNRKIAAESLGADFTDRFLNTDTRSYDSIEVETLAGWAKALGGTIPVTQETASIPEQPAMALYPPELANKIVTYQDTRDKMFPMWNALQTQYYALPAGNQRRSFLQRFPVLKQYWSWNREYKADHPDLTPYFEDLTRDKDVEASLSDITSPLMRQLYELQYTGKALSPGAQAELKRLWKTYTQGMEYAQFIKLVGELVTK